MDEIIKIKCPFCGAVLSVKNIPDIENKNVTCPICKHKYAFNQFKTVPNNSKAEEPGTKYPDGASHDNYEEEHTSYQKIGADNDGSSLLNFTLGRLVVEENGAEFQLKFGRNVIGRKGQRSEADFQIDTAEKRQMSREHIVIEVKRVPNKGFVHFVSLFKERVNDTFIGNEPLLYGDCIVLNNGDTIRLPNATLKFEIPDNESTDF